MEIKSVYEHLWMWHQNLARLTTHFVEETETFFNHCQKVEKDFALTTNHLLGVWEELHSKLMEQNKSTNKMMSDNNLVITTVEEREAHIQLLVDKFTTLALEFERILRDSERPSIINYDDQNFVPPPSLLLSSSNCQLVEENEKDEEDDEKSTTNSTQNSSNNSSSSNNCHLDNLSDFLERAMEDLSNFCEYRKEALPVAACCEDDGDDQNFRKNYLHFERTPILEPLNELLRLVEMELVRLWKNEDRLHGGPLKHNFMTIRSAGTQTVDEERVDKFSKNTEKEIQLWLFQEKLFLSHQRDELGKVERQLRSREDNVRRQEKQFILDKENWEKEKKNWTPSLTTTVVSPVTARVSCSEGNLINSSDNTQIIPPILSPPPDRKASSFDRFKRFPHVHPLSERFKEISDSAKSFGPSGFNRYHFYLSKMTDVLEFYQHKDLQLSERIESNKFVSVITAAAGVKNNNEDLNVDGNIIAIGHGNTALQATEKAVQMTHDFIQNSSVVAVDSSSKMTRINFDNFDKSPKNPRQIHNPALLFDVLGAGDM